MRLTLLSALLCILISCSGVNKDIRDGRAGGCNAVGSRENFAPYIGKCIEIKGTVADEGSPSIIDYWIPIPELDKFRGQRVSVRGTLLTKNESSSGGKDKGSERGVYYISVMSIELLK